MERYDSLIGTSPGPRKIEYTWRDVALYALSIGAKPEELYYYYERDLKGIPSFGMLPVWSAKGTPERPGPYPGVMKVLDVMTKELGHIPAGLDWSNDMIVYRPFDPIKGSFLFEDTITNIYDRGKGKGVVVESECPVYDEAFNLICKNIHRCCFYGTDGYGGRPLPPSEGDIPDREPDVVVEDKMYNLQNAFYRLAAGAYRAEDHIDPELAKKNSLPAPTMPGFCLIGFACRMAIEALIPGEPERVTRLKADIRGLSFPGDKLTLTGWKTEKGIVFRLLNPDTGKKILDRGILEYK